jgi:hypothetical protein
VQTDDGQAGIFFDAGALKVSPDAQAVIIRIEPLAAAPPPPARLMIIGNVYRVAITEQPAGVPVGLARPIQVTVRAPPGPDRTLQSYDGRSWRLLHVVRITGHYVTASLPELGDVAATTASAKGAARPRLSALDLVRLVPPLGFAASAVVLVLLAAALTVRRRRLR